MMTGDTSTEGGGSNISGGHYLLLPPLDTAMSEAVLGGVQTYLDPRQNTVAQFIETRPIMDMCLTAERRPGARVSQGWWEQGTLGLEAMCLTERAAEMKGY